MDINLQLPPETEQRLRQQAQAAGQDIKSFVMEALEEKLAGGGSETTSAESHPEERIARFRAWLATHHSKLTFADDSRESIYDGRGE